MYPNKHQLPGEFPGGSVVKNPAANAGDAGWIPELGRSPGHRASSGVETGMSGNFLSCRKGVKDPLEVPDVRCD